MSWERERRGRLDLGVHRLFDTTSRLFDDFTGEVHLHGEGGDFVLENEELFLVEAFFASEDLLDQLVHVLFAVAETFHHTREAFGRVGLGVVELVHARGVSFFVSPGPFGFARCCEWSGSFRPDLLFAHR